MNNTTNPDELSSFKSEEDLKREFNEIDMRDLYAQIVKTSYWFYYIAAFSVVNSIFIILEKPLTFQLGLGITQIFDFLFLKYIGDSTVVATILDFILIGCFASLGYWAGNFKKWAFLAGMIIYGADSIIFIVTNLWISVLIHAIVLYMFYRGYSKIIRYNNLVEESYSL